MNKTLEAIISVEKDLQNAIARLPTEGKGRSKVQDKDVVIAKMRQVLQRLAIDLAAEAAVASRAGQMESLEVLSKLALDTSKAQ